MLLDLIAERLVLRPARRLFSNSFNILFHFLSWTQALMFGCSHVSDFLLVCVCVRV